MIQRGNKNKFLSDVVGKYYNEFYNLPIKTQYICIVRENTTRDNQEKGSD